MMLATLGASRELATPGATGATCPGCGQPVIPKCGQVNIWHWAHARGADCDPWYEPMSAWHLAWQEAVPAERREVVFGNHRADIVTARGQVVEIQHSHLAAQEIAEREQHYGPMVWIFDAIDKGIELDTGGNGAHPAYRVFRWRHARRFLTQCERTVFLDLGDELLLVGHIYPEMPLGGWGYLWSRQRAIDCLNEPATHPRPVAPAPQEVGNDGPRGHPPHALGGVMTTTQLLAHLDGEPTHDRERQAL